MVALAIEAKAAQLRNEHNARAVLAWNIAALSRTRRLPNVRSLFVREGGGQQTWQEAEMLMKQWHANQLARKKLMERAN